MKSQPAYLQSSTAVERAGQLLGIISSTLRAEESTAPSVLAENIQNFAHEYGRTPSEVAAQLYVITRMIDKI
jgi:hypothetical protein